MKISHDSTIRIALFAAALAFSLAPRAPAQTETALYTFTSPGPKGPTGNLIADASGNLYGTTTMGGRLSGLGCKGGCGTVFELSPGASGWTKTTLYEFRGGTNGLYPNAALVFDAAGNLFGITAKSGGAFGTIFELSPGSGAGWAHKLLHEFTGGKDGGYPSGPLIFDGAGNLYGTAAEGGNVTGCNGKGCGVVFELERTSKGGWAEIVLHTFTGTDGENPYSGLTWDAAGNLYGTTSNGGNLTDCSGSGCGVVFRLVPVLAGGWKLTPIHTFTGGRDGANPFLETLVFDASGALYGSTANGGASNFGVVFRLAKSSAGGWVETVLHSFKSGTDGANPNAGVVLGTNGIVYGTTLMGGGGCPVLGCGTLFSLSPTAGGWTEQVFPLSSINGAYPYGLLFNEGNVFGVTVNGGPDHIGVVYELTP